MVITFSNIKGTGGGGGATGGTVSGITLWSDETTKDYIDNAISGVTAELSAYTPTSGFCTINGSAITEGGNIEIVGTPYSAGTNIDITDYVISVTGITIPTSNTAFTNDAGYITSDALSGYSTTQEMNTAIDNAVSGKMDTSAMSAYTPTSGFSTINGSAITQGGNITVEETPYSGGTGIGVENHVISVTGDYETVVELTQAEYDALTAYTENTTYIITDAPAINMSAYTPTSGFSTINGSAITSGDAIVIETGNNYSAGTNIQITDNVISVTGITVPTKLSDLTNDEGFITSDALSGYSTTQEMNTAIDNAVSGKQDTSAMTQYYTSGETDTAISNATSGLASQSWVENKGYLTGYTETDPVFMASPASGITAQDITNWNAVTGLTIPTSNTAFTNDAGYITEDALSGYSTTEEMNTAIDNATSGKADTTYVDNSVSGKADTTAVTADIAAATAATTGWVESQGYLTGYTETEPIFTGSPAYGITSQDITNWNSVSGKADTSRVDEIEEVAASAITDLNTRVVELSGNSVTTGTVQSMITAATSGLQETLVSGTNIKTINNESILGSGNITIQGGGGASVVDYNPLQVEFQSAYSYIDYYELVNSGTTRQYKGRIAFDTINGNTIFHSDDNNKVNWTIPTSGDIQTQIDSSISGKVDTTAMTQYATTGSVSSVESHIDEVEEVVASALTNLHSTKQDTLVSGTNIKTINNQSLLGSGNIDIQGGSGGGETFIELTQAEYEALTAYTEDTTYIITDADVVNLDNYATTGDVATISSALTTLSGSVETKANAANISSNSYRKFPKWNAQGIITGTTGSTVYTVGLNVNGSNNSGILRDGSAGNLPAFYAPTSAGSQGQPLLSNGSGAPVWGSYKFQFISQSAYDALVTKDSTTIYFIISEN